MPFQSQTINTAQELGIDNVAVLYEGPTMFSKTYLDVRITDTTSLIWSQLLTYLKMKGWEVALTEKNSVAVVSNQLDYGYLHYLNLAGDIAQFFVLTDEIKYSYWKRWCEFADLNCVLRASKLINLLYPEKSKDYKGFNQRIALKFNI
jgi:hypothetical protein